MNLQGACLRKPDSFRDDSQPHLYAIMDGTGDRAEGIGFLGLRKRGTGLVSLALSNEGHPPVNSAGAGTTSERKNYPGEHRNAKIHCDGLADGSPGCKSYRCDVQASKSRRLASVEALRKSLRSAEMPGCFAVCICVLLSRRRPV